MMLVICVAAQMQDDVNESNDEVAPEQLDEEAVGINSEDRSKRTLGLLAGRVARHHGGGFGGYGGYGGYYPSYYGGYGYRPYYGGYG